MIKYRLICEDCKITFDSWFSSSKEYERLKKKNFLNCHICSSLSVEKTLMSPSVFVSKNNSKASNEIKKHKETKVIILKWVKIKSWSVIWAGSTVTKELKDKWVYVGSPAKIIKKL